MTKKEEEVDQSAYIAALKAVHEIEQQYQQIPVDQLQACT